MLEQIRQHEVLRDYLEDTCFENGVGVTMDPRIKESEYVILKVDNYYNENVHPAPPSPDCLIIQKCKSGGFAVTLVELKNISSSSGFTVENMLGKFETCLTDFMLIRFTDILGIDYKRMKLFFVTNKDIYGRDLGLKMETLISTSLRYKDKKILIQPFMPTPAIKKCY